MFLFGDSILIRLDMKIAVVGVGVAGAYLMNRLSNACRKYMLQVSRGCRKTNMTQYVPGQHVKT